MSGIEWTDETWNPVVGCSPVSKGCDNCYAAHVAHRAMQPAHEGLTHINDDGDIEFNGVVRCLPERLDVPLRWRKPRRIFVDSMSDLFHPAVPFDFVFDVVDVMARCQRHTFQILTKRPKRMADMMAVIGCPPNVGLGTSIELDQLTWRANHLRRLAGSPGFRFLSLEPLLGPLPSLDLTGIDWVITGGESGGRARSMEAEWAADLRDRCAAAGVPFFFKQAGRVLAKKWGMSETKGKHLDEMPVEFRVRQPLETTHALL